MSDHCRGCRYTPTKRVGDDACPYSTLYWHFLDRHRPRLGANQRLRRLYDTFDRFDPEEVDEIRARGDELRADFRA
jgi:deoxyribodipyrimidine photolyase-related protein